MELRELNDILAEECRLYLGCKGSTLMQVLFPDRRFLIWCCLDSFRRLQFWREAKSKGGAFARLKAKLLFYFYNRKYISFSIRSGVELDVNSRIGRHCDIWHGGIVVNGDLGDNCVLHGNNIIGNKGVGRADERPRIGNNVDIGAGAVVIGGISIADGCKIGANAAVVKSVETENAVVVGIPGRILDR